MWQRTPSSTYMRLVAEDWMSRYWWVAAIPVAICIIGGLWFHPFFWALIPVLVCLVAPVIVMILYFNYSLTPEAISSVRPHKTTVEPDGSLTIDFMPDEETGREYRPVHIDACEVGSVELRGGNIVVKLKEKPCRFVVIPFTDQVASVYNL